ncbi:MAG: putative toxin-antitoxin system toxin component, PIN family [Anaerolineae bacterium]
MPERVVFDTNVLISGLLWRGKAYQCLLLARSGVVQAIYCSEMMAELSEKLRDKFRFSENRIRAVVHDVRRFAERVEISGTLSVVEADPDDDKFVECAVVGRADAIVSGDRHLLDMDRYQNIPILSAAEFIEWIASRPTLAREE